MSKKGTLNFYFNEKTYFGREERSDSISIQSSAIEDLSNETLTISDSTVFPSTPSSLSTTISLDINTEPMTNYSQSPDDAGTAQLFKRDPCRGPSFANEFILIGPYQPKCHYPTVQKRHFCQEWFQTYKWLEYSPTNDKAYCFFCRFAYHPVKSEKAFTVVGFNNWANAIRKFDKHQSSMAHKHSHETCVNAEKNRLND